MDVDLKYVDYCGTRDSGERVMGLAHFNPLSNSLTPDPALCWQLPHKWAMEDAVTVPVAYSLAYYSLHVKAKLKPGESVLVHVGSSPVSQACIAIALQAGANVFVTVQTDQSRNIVHNEFPQLKQDQILSLENFYVPLKIKTKGLGVQVIVNCLGAKGRELSQNCMATYSRFIHFTAIDTRQRQSVGMNIFLLYTHFFGISLTNILNSDLGTKNKLQIYLKDGLKRGVVKPVRKKLFHLHNFAQAVEHLKTRNCEEKSVVVVKGEGRSELSSSLHGFHCEPDKSYVIVGSGKGLWLDVAEWLVQRGARKLLVAPNKDRLDISLCRRFDRLVMLSYVRLVLKSAPRLNSTADARDLLLQAETLAPVAAVFCISFEENSPKVSHLDMASRQVSPQLKQFVCLLGGSSRVYEARVQLGLPACLINKEDSCQLSRLKSVLPCLSAILTNTGTSNHHFLISDQVLRTNLEENILSEQEVCYLLPSSVSELVTLAEEVQDQLSLREVVTLSPHHEIVKYNVLPVFIIPGTHSAHLQPIIRNMMHPAYCVSLPEKYTSVEILANSLLEEVISVQQSGPYNVVGESWSGALALQLAILLESRGEQVELFLLDAAPQTLQSCVQSLCDRNMNSLDTSLLITVLRLSNQKSKELTQCKVWEELVQKALHLGQTNLKMQEEILSSWKCLEKALTMLRSHLTALMAYKPPTQLFKGVVHLIRPRKSVESDPCGLQLYCQQAPLIHVTEDEDLEKMLGNRKNANIINENVIYSWDL